MDTLIVGNWKMEISLQRGRELVREIEAMFSPGPEIVVCPPFTHLRIVKTHIAKTKLGAQDLFWEERGPYTGEISPLTLKELGCEYVIIGHSERRKYLGETDKMVNQKVKAALKNNLRPILCIGETKEERRQKQTLDIIEDQLKQDLAGIQNFNLLVIAYEPVWSIGTGETPSPDEIERIAQYIYQVLGSLVREKAGQPRILYGGSVDAGNVTAFVKQKNVQGVLVGGASVDTREFTRIIKAFSF